MGRSAAMKTAVLLAVMLAGLEAQQHPQQRHFLTNQDVVNLAKAGFGEQTIIATVLARPSRFDTNVDALAALAAQGLSQRVVEAMVEARACGSASDVPHAPRCGSIETNAIQRVRK